MSAHTPGPWHVYGLPGQARIIGPNGQAVAACRAKYRTPEHAHERDCNARLIAAAPELLAALQESIGIIRTFHGEDVWDIYHDNAPEMKRLRAAIAKATGGA